MQISMLTSENLASKEGPRGGKVAEPTVDKASATRKYVNIYIL